MGTDGWIFFSNDEVKIEIVVGKKVTKLKANNLHNAGYYNFPTLLVLTASFEIFNFIFLA